MKPDVYSLIPWLCKVREEPANKASTIGTLFEENLAEFVIIYISQDQAFSFYLQRGMGHTTFQHCQERHCKHPDFHCQQLLQNALPGSMMCLCECMLCREGEEGGAWGQVKSVGESLTMTVLTASTAELTALLRAVDLPPPRDML